MATAPPRVALHPGTAGEAFCRLLRMTRPMSPAASPPSGHGSPSSGGPGGSGFHAAGAMAPSGTGPTALPPPSPFALARSHDDTALYQDGRTGFSHLLPGRPRFARPDAGGSGPHAAFAPYADALLVLEDAPITIRYRLEPPRVNAPTAQDVAHLTAVLEARARAGVHAESATVDHANTTWLAAWGVEGAAVAAYDVAPVSPEGPHEREDLFVLVRGGLVLTVRWTYPRELATDPVYAMFASVAEATMIWDADRWQEQQRARVWPESRILGPGLRAVLPPALLDHARELATRPLPPAEREALLSVLSTVVSNAGAPWVPIAAPERRAATSLLQAATQDARIHGFVAHLLDEVRNAHDLRGVALLLARAVLEPGTRSSRPPARAAEVPSQSARQLYTSPMPIPRETAPSASDGLPRIPSSLGMPRPNVVRRDAGPPKRVTPPPVPAVRREPRSTSETRRSVPPPVPPPRTRKP
jgi:hypothetical protein